jgi:hypothetical protein
LLPDLSFPLSPAHKIATPYQNLALAPKDA